MKPILLLVLVALCCSNVSAQSKTVRPTTAKAAKTAPGKTKRKVATKKITGKTAFDELICYEDGPCTFSIHKGDTLVYDVNANGKQYTLLVVPNRLDALLGDFNWKTLGGDTKSGHVTVNSTALKSSKKYLSYFPAGELKLTDASAMWLCSDNFSEINKKQTSLAFDNGAAETFSSPDDDAVMLNINYKGRDTNLDAFAIQSKPEGEPGRKEVWVLNISNNLLLVKIDAGFQMQLKEVREKRGK